MRTGYTYAQRHGYRRAIQGTRTGNTTPSDIDRVLAGLEHADISIGARFSDVGDYEVPRPAPVGDGLPRVGALARPHIRD